MDDEERRPTARRTSRSRTSGARPAGEPEPVVTPARRRRSTTKARLEVSTVQVSIAVDDAYMDDFADIIERGRELGLQVEQQLPEVGVIMGRMPADKIDDMAACKGVYAIERPRSFRIAPPEDDLQ
jgi:hypothetical protein